MPAHTQGSGTHMVLSSDDLFHSTRGKDRVKTTKLILDRQSM